MYYVYILKSLSSAIYYTGIAKDVRLIFRNTSDIKPEF